jgi:integrase
MNEDEFKQVERARAKLLKDMDGDGEKQGKGAITRETEKQYQEYAMRFESKKMAATLKGEQLAFSMRNVNTIRMYRSAVNYHNRSLMLALDRETDFQSAKEVLQKVMSDNKIIGELEKQEKEKTPVSKKLKGKVARLEKRVPDWRARMDRIMEGKKYESPYVVQRVTGCRTEELKRGVFVEKVADGKYLLHVETAKQKAASAKDGSERTRVIASNDPRLEKLAGKIVSVPKNTNYSKTIGGLTLRHFQQEMGPYSLRYAVAADLKASGASINEQAEFLGHENDRTAGRYSSGLSSTAGREKPATLEKARVRVQKRDERSIPSKARSREQGMGIGD